MHVIYVLLIDVSSSRVYSDMKFDLPFMLYQGRRYAFKKVQKMDPSSTQRGVRQFKTYMSIKLDQVSFCMELFMMLFPLIIALWTWVGWEFQWLMGSNTQQEVFSFELTYLIWFNPSKLLFTHHRFLMSEYLG